ncbi:MAG: SPOR domain-containing protein [Deltaproteobacteria bacterium]|nr:SPOR domain-containing protein [Deltaproteobacteria bacterium]
MATSLKRQKNIKKKSSKFIYILLFLIMILGGLTYYFWSNIQQQVFNFQEDDNGLMKKFKIEKPEPVKESIFFKPEEKRPSTSGKKKYYLLVQKCVYPHCRSKLSNQLQNLSYSTFTRSKQQSTKYYHLVSENAYNINWAEDKLSLLNGFNDRLPPAILLRNKKKYRISFGEFPSYNEAFKYEKYFEQFINKTQVEFTLETKNKIYKEVSIYAGPFSSKQQARKAKQKVSEHIGIEGNIVSRL